VGYVGAGTVEFIAEEVGDGEDLRFYFMEMNTRLQVEHPVTEAITGLDLVEWQLRVAAGQPLPLTQQQLAIRGHAIEARICAESPDANFLPATGTMHVARWPQHVSFVRSDTLPRVDRGFDEGDTISPHYDSMIAKLIVWGDTRAQALARLDAALAGTHIVGLSTNVAFLGRVVNSQAFARADLDTALIERERTALFEYTPLPIECAAAGVVARELALEAALQGDDPWSRRDGWRLFGGATRRFDLDVGGTPHRATLHRGHDAALTLAVGDRHWPFSSRALGADRHDVSLGDQRWTLAVYAEGERITVFAPHGSLALQEIDPLAHAGEGAAQGRLTAPMPGKVVALLAKVGDRVKAGQPLAVMEAMKMEHTIAAPRDGIIAELLHAVGDQVAEGGELLRLEAVA
jgi:3-methylcrotonyl-CoA carboxylase alpha subunit